MKRMAMLATGRPMAANRPAARRRAATTAASLTQPWPAMRMATRRRHGGGHQRLKQRAQLRGPVTAGADPADQQAADRHGQAEGEIAERRAQPEPAPPCPGLSRRIATQSTRSSRDQVKTLAR